MSEKFCSAFLVIVISFIASAVACLVQASLAMDFALSQLSGPRKHLVPRATFFVCYHHIKDCLMGTPFNYGASWSRKPQMLLALK